MFQPFLIFLVMFIICFSFSSCSDFHLADIAAAVFNGIVMCSTMIPLAVYTSKILLMVTRMK